MIWMQLETLDKYLKKMTIFKQDGDLESIFSQSKWKLSISISISRSQY